MTLMTELQAQLIRGFPLHVHLGLDLEQQRDAVAVILPDQRATRTHLGTQGAASLFAVADAAAGVALISLLRPHLDAFAGLVSNADAEFFRPAVGRIVSTGRVVADVELLLARLEADGRAKTDVIATLQDPDGQVTSEMTVTWHLRIPSSHIPALWQRDGPGSHEERRP